MAGIKAKAAPEAIRTAKEAREGFARIEDYRRAARDALQRYHQSGMGTTTASKHYERFEQYDTVADAWASAMRAWLDKQS